MMWLNRKPSKNDLVSNEFTRPIENRHASVKIAYYHSIVYTVADASNPVNSEEPLKCDAHISRFILDESKIYFHAIVFL